MATLTREFSARRQVPGSDERRPIGWVVQFDEKATGRRPQIRLGPVSKKVAGNARRHIEQYVAAQRPGLDSSPIRYRSQAGNTPGEGVAEAAAATHIAKRVSEGRRHEIGDGMRVARLTSAKALRSVDCTTVTIAAAGCDGESNAIESAHVIAGRVTKEPST